jgi:HNH endonuclease
MLNPSATNSDEYGFWGILKRFRSEDRIREWRNVIFPDQNRPDKGLETCHNLICLSPDAHAYWTKAYFALKPIQLSDDKKTFVVEFHWMPQHNYFSKVDLLTSPKSLEGSDGRAKVKLLHFPTERKICSGQKITLTTDDPVARPLPHPVLLEMQWILHRVATMSAAAEIYDGFDNDDDDEMALYNEWDLYGEDEWDPYKEDEWGSIHRR